MTLLSDLFNVYEANIDKTTVEDQKFPLIPLGYTATTAHIMVGLNRNGQFIQAEVCEPRQSVMVPCTIESAGRSSGVTPHPLHDKLTYVAGDSQDYGMSLRNTKTGQTSFQVYLAQLQAWVESEYADQNVKAIYHYIKQRTLIKDLVAVNVLYADAENVLVDKWPGDSKDPAKNEIFRVVPGKQTDAFIYFKVLDADENRESISRSWAAYYLHYLEEHGEKGLDYVTGELMALTTNHARDIRYGGDGAKLISSNDTSGFTYRGRFLSAEQAATVGYETSSKAFSALKWLIRNQGYSVNGRVFLAWGEHGENEPLPTNSRGNPIPIEDPTDINFAKQHFKQYLKGKDFDLSSSHTIHLLVLDAATPGRMDLIYYQNYDQKYYFTKLEQWYETMSIQIVDIGEMKQQTVSLSQLVHAAFGDRVADSLMAETMLRLVRCVTDNAAKIPTDLARQIIRRAGRPLSFTENKQNWEYALQAAVAVNQKNFVKEGIPVTLDKKDHDRSYLFGRLLAVADKIESDVLRNREEDRKVKRPTAALRYMSSFEQHPDSTWQTIHRLLLPYMSRNQQRDYYQKLIGEIMEGINEHDGYNKPLNARYLTGYYHERNELYRSKQSKNTQGDEK